MTDSVPLIENLYRTKLPRAGREGAEIVEELLRGRSFRVERIVSSGQATPESEWYDQTEEEWVVLLQGAAKIRFEEGPQLEDGIQLGDRSKTCSLAPGDSLLIPAHCRHRVEWTSPTELPVWLAIHFTE